MHFFPTGIWSAALGGDLERVRSFLKKGADPNMKDQAGYTALVSSNPILYLPEYYSVTLKCYFWPKSFAGFFLIPYSEIYYSICMLMVRLAFI